MHAQIELEHTEYETGEFDAETACHRASLCEIVTTIFSFHIALKDTNRRLLTAGLARTHMTSSEELT